MQLSFHAQHHVNRTKMAKPSPLDLLVSQVSHPAWSHSTDKSNAQVNYVLQLKMGGSGSKSKGFWPFSGSGSGDDQSKDSNEQSLARARSFPGATPFVFTRRSSLFFDEDGDLAHEFYEETIVTKNGRKKAKLRRIYKNLTPQGIIKLDLPCIHVDFPVVLCEV